MMGAWVLVQFHAAPGELSLIDFSLRQTVSKLPTEVLVRERKAEQGFLFTNRVKRSRLGVRRVVGGVR